MRKAGYKILNVIIFILLAGTSYAQQDCSQQPAPCPKSGSISETMDAAHRTKNNDIYLQEIQMENQLRNLLTVEAQNIAKAHGWQVYELNEEGTSGPPYIFISYTDWEATAFNKRPPHQYQISFVFIINQDSLQAWRNWLLNDMQKQEDQAVQQFNQSQTNPLLQQYQDSITHYVNLYTSFLQNNTTAYVKDIQDKNQKGTDNYQRNKKVFLDKIDFFQKKYQDVQQHSNSGFDAENDIINHKTVAFAAGSIAIIHFYINPYKADFALENEQQVNILPQHPINILHAFYAGITTNNAAPDRHNYELNYRDFVFNSPACIATVLFGNYLPKDSYNYYPATFTKNFNNRQGVIGNVKLVSCDKVQNILVHIEGSSYSANAIINSVDWLKLSALIYKQ
jgi:hypothetical protein